jgi:hypothetical protein
MELLGDCPHERERRKVLKYSEIKALNSRENIDAWLLVYR